MSYLLPNSTTFKKTLQKLTTTQYDHLQGSKQVIRANVRYKIVYLNIVYKKA